MQRHPIVRSALALAALTMLCSCILVEDFADAWKQSVTDPCLSKIAQSLYATEFRRDPSKKDMATLARAFTLGNEHFLLLKQQPEDKGGRMYRFTVATGVPSSIFTRYRLNPTMRETFEKTHPNAPVSLDRDTVTLAALTPQTEKLLLEIAQQPDYWEVEEKTLYNPFHNATCHFEPQDQTNIDKPVGKPHVKK
jgi:hypothetical protein